MHSGSNPLSNEGCLELPWQKPLAGGLKGRKTIFIFWYLTLINYLTKTWDLPSFNIKNASEMKS